MNKFKKTALASVCGLAVITMMTGCGGGDDKKAAAIPASVQGVANKGIMKHAKVEIFSIKDGVISTSPIAEAVTDEQGKYTVNVNFSGPVLVVASRLDNTSMMVCDVAAGCNNGTVAFGSDFAMPSALQLKAVANVVSGEQSINVTSLTHLAATLAESAPVIGAEAVSAANSQVADLFELTGDLTKFETVDVSDTAAFEAATPQEQRNALLSAGIYGAAIDKGLTLDDVASDFVGHNGQLLNSTIGSGEVDLGGVLATAREILNTPEYTSVDSATLETELTADIMDAVILGETTTDSQPAPDAISGNMQKVQGMVNDLRNVGVSVNLQTQSEAFGREADIARQLLADDSAAVRNALGLSLKAIGKLKQQRDDKPNTTFTSPKTITLTEERLNFETWMYETVVIARIPVAFVGNEYKVTGKVNGIDVKVTANIDFAPDVTEDNIKNGTVKGTSTHVVANEKLSISGSASNANVEFLITKGTASVAFTNDEQETTDTANGNTAFDQTINNFTVNLDVDVTINQKQTVSGTVVTTSTSGDETTAIKQTEGNKLSGHLTVALVEFDQAEIMRKVNEACQFNDNCIDSWGYDYSNWEGYYSQNNTTHTESSFKTASFTFLGKFDNQVKDNHVNVNFVYNMAGNGVVIVDDMNEKSICSSYSDPMFGNQEFCYPLNWDNSPQSDTTTEETATQFLAGSFSLDVGVDLAGISSETKLHIGGDRKSLDEAGVNGFIAYDGKRITFEIPVDRKTVDGEDSAEARYLKITNHNNVVITAKPNQFDELSGDITMNGVKYATISEQNGLTLIRYTNGQFETLE